MYSYPDLKFEVEEFKEEADEANFKSSMEQCYLKNDSLKQYCDDAYNLEYFGILTEK